MYINLKVYHNLIDVKQENNPVCIILDCFLIILFVSL